MIILLDDLTSHLYGKLKIDSDKLSEVRLAIKWKAKLIAVYLDMWIEYNQFGTNQADTIYLQKHKLEVELQKLEKDAEILTKRIAKLC